MDWVYLSVMEKWRQVIGLYGDRIGTTAYVEYIYGIRSMLTYAIGTIDSFKNGEPMLNQYLLCPLLNGDV